ncbi:hypothetical protein [Nostoc sp.]
MVEQLIGKRIQIPGQFTGAVTVERFDISASVGTARRRHRRL